MNVLFLVDHLALWPMVAANACNMHAKGEGESLFFHIETMAIGDAVRQRRGDLEPADGLAGQLRQQDGLAFIKSWQMSGKIGRLQQNYWYDQYNHDILVQTSLLRLHISRL